MTSAHWRLASANLCPLVMWNRRVCGPILEPETQALRIGLPTLTKWLLAAISSHGVIVLGANVWFKTCTGVSFNKNFVVELPLSKATAWTLPQGDVERGKHLYSEICANCHSLDPIAENPRSGPTLAGIWGRRAGTLPGFRFSKSEEKKGALKIIRNKIKHQIK